MGPASIAPFCWAHPLEMPFSAKGLQQTAPVFWCCCTGDKSKLPRAQIYSKNKTKQTKTHAHTKTTNKTKTTRLNNHWKLFLVPVTLGGEKDNADCRLLGSSLSQSSKTWPCVCHINPIHPVASTSISPNLAAGSYALELVTETSYSSRVLQHQNLGRIR